MIKRRDAEAVARGCPVINGHAVNLPLEDGLVGWWGRIRGVLAGDSRSDFGTVRQQGRAYALRWGEGPAGAACRVSALQVEIQSPKQKISSVQHR